MTECMQYRPQKPGDVNSVCLDPAHPHDCGRDSGAGPLPPLRLFPSPTQPPPPPRLSSTSPHAYLSPLPALLGRDSILQHTKINWNQGLGTTAMQNLLRNTVLFLIIGTAPRSFVGDPWVIPRVQVQPGGGGGVSGGDHAGPAGAARSYVSSRQCRAARQGGASGGGGRAPEDGPAPAWAPAMSGGDH